MDAKQIRIWRAQHVRPVEIAKAAVEGEAKAPEVRTPPVGRPSPRMASFVRLAKGRMHGL